VNDVVFIFEGFEAHGCGVSYLAEDGFRDAVTVDSVNGAAVHEFYADVYGSFLEEGAIEIDYIGGQAAVEDVEFHNDGGEFGFVEFEAEFFHGHDYSCC
jgi:hypothetical protein